MYVSVRKFCSRGVGNFLLVGGWITYLRRLAVWAAENVLKIFILIEIFGNSTIFHHFDTSISSIETLTDNLEFKGKTLAKFLRRSHVLSI